LQARNDLSKAWPLAICWGPALLDQLAQLFRGVLGHVRSHPFVRCHDCCLMTIILLEWYLQSHMKYSNMENVAFHTLVGCAEYRPAQPATVPYLSLMHPRHRNARSCDCIPAFRQHAGPQAADQKLAALIRSCLPTGMFRSGITASLK